jgi:DNA-binding IclR family transcriptional regulator
MHMPTQTAPLKTVDRSFTIIDALRKARGSTLADLAGRLDLPKSTIHRHIQTLVGLGYVEADGQGYALTARFVSLGGAVQNSHPGFRIIRQKVDEIAAETGERVQYMIDHGGQRVYLYVQTGERAVATNSSLGKTGYLHASAAGKAMLAARPDAAVDAYIDDHGLLAETDRTITDPAAFRKELEAVRIRGVAFNDEETTRGLRAVAAAVQEGERVHGAISIAGPAHRLKGADFRQRYPDILLAATNELELNLTYQD